MTAIVFWGAYILLFLAGGAITLFGVFPFRTAYASFVPLLLIPVSGLVLNRVTLSIGLFVLGVLLSALANGSSPSQALLFMRFALTPYMMYYLATCYLSHRSVVPILRVSLLVGLVQPPVVLCQRVFYSTIMAHAANPVGPIDANFGTFLASDDPAMSFFLLGLILFLLFDDGNNSFVRHRYAKAAWLTIAILLANSIMSQLIAGGIWAYFILSRLSAGTLVRAAAVAAVGGLVLLRSGYVSTWNTLLVPAVSSVVSRQAVDPTAFLSGSYSRQAAIAYYLSRSPKLLGDGPSRYYDPVTRRYVLGNTGQVFTMYAEAGLLGLALSYWILWVMGATGNGGSRESRVLYFGALVGLTVTSSVMTDASIMLAYALFSRTGLVSGSGSKGELPMTVQADHGRGDEPERPGQSEAPHVRSG